MNGDLRENCRLLDEKLHRAVNPDMHVRFFRTFSRDAAVYYVDGLISTDFMQHYLLSPLQNAAETVSSGVCSRWRRLAGSTNTCGEPSSSSTICPSSSIDAARSGRSVITHCGRSENG